SEHGFVVSIVLAKTTGSRCVLLGMRVRRLASSGKERMNMGRRSLRGMPGLASKCGFEVLTTRRIAMVNVVPSLVVAGVSSK
ncbi:MAG: hypothetical protein ACPIOQ_85330, partial [Promethearchaeia archaeon]